MPTSARRRRSERLCVSSTADCDIEQRREAAGEFARARGPPLPVDRRLELTRCKICVQALDGPSATRLIVGVDAEAALIHDFFDGVTLRADGENGSACSGVFQYLATR